MNIVFKRMGSVGIGLLCLSGSGCGRKESYTQMEVGPHGQVTRMTKVKYTSEEIAARDAQMGYAPSVPSDPDLATLQQSWPKLTPEQRASVIQSVKKMTGEATTP